MRSDLHSVHVSEQVAVDLRLLTSHRLDVVHDRVHTINRLRATLLEYFAVLEQAFDFSKNEAVLCLLSRYATPGDLRRIGATRLAAWLKASGCRNSTRVAEVAVDASRTQTVVLQTQTIGAALVAKLAAQIAATRTSLWSMPRSSGLFPETTRLSSWSQCPASVPSSRPPSSPRPAGT